jgi:hypothetical protein
MSAGGEQQSWDGVYYRQADGQSSMSTTTQASAELAMTTAPNYPDASSLSA